MKFPGVSEVAGNFPLEIDRVGEMGVITLCDGETRMESARGSAGIAPAQVLLLLLWRPGAGRQRCNHKNE